MRGELRSRYWTQIAIVVTQNVSHSLFPKGRKADFTICIRASFRSFHFLGTHVSDLKFQLDAVEFWFFTLVWCDTIGCLISWRQKGCIGRQDLRSKFCHLQCMECEMSVRPISLMSVACDQRRTLVGTQCVRMLLSFTSLDLIFRSLFALVGSSQSFHGELITRPDSTRNPTRNHNQSVKSEQFFCEFCGLRLWNLFGRKFLGFLFCLERGTPLRCGPSTPPVEWSFACSSMTDVWYDWPEICWKQFLFHFEETEEILEFLIESKSSAESWHLAQDC